MSASPQKKMKFSKNKSKYYGKPNKEQYLISGMQGFMATCNFREKDCVREAYNVLNHYADELIGPEEKNVGNEAPVEDGAGDDIADQLEKEVNAVNYKQKTGTNRRFKSVETGASNCVFIRASTSVDPIELGSRIVEDIKSSGEQKTRFLLRLIPIEAVCRIDELDSTAGKLFDKHFLKQGSSYSIVFNRRFNNDVKRDKVIADLAELVHSKNVANRVDLKNPEKTVVVEIIKGLCLLGVVPSYIQNKKYNLVELASSNKKAKEADKSGADVNESEKTVEKEPKDEQKVESEDNVKDDA